MILEQINKENVIAFKEKNTLVKDIISVIKSREKLLEIEKRTKNETVTDADIVKLLQKLIKELEEALENYKKVNNEGEVNNITVQIKFCEKFLPKFLEKDEIKNIINGLEDKSIPSVMKHFKEKYAGQVNMKDVQDVLKSL